MKGIAFKSGYKDYKMRLKGKSQMPAPPKARLIQAIKELQEEGWSDEYFQGMLACCLDNEKICTLSQCKQQ